MEPVTLITGSLHHPIMTANWIADSVLFALNQPAGMAINHIQMRPMGQIN
ncbi:hypothetical protein ABZW18_30305 [Streptomyces sp. NPDC004647]